MNPLFANYNKELIDLLDVIGSYFVSVYYNNIYNSASADQRSIIDEYQRQVSTYINAIKTNSESYDLTINDLHRWVTQQPRYHAHNYHQFINMISANFVPEEFTKTLRTENKDELVHQIIADLVSDLGHYITSPQMIRSIIDGHDSMHVSNISNLKDQAVSFLLGRRQDIRNRFLGKVSQAKGTVPSEIVEKLKSTLKKYVKENEELKGENDELSDDVERLEEKVEDLKNEIRRYRDREKKFERMVRLLYGSQAASRNAPFPQNDQRMSSVNVSPLHDTHGTYDTHGTHGTYGTHDAHNTHDAHSAYNARDTFGDRQTQAISADFFNTGSAPIHQAYETHDMGNTRTTRSTARTTARGVTQGTSQGATRTAFTLDSARDPHSKSRTNSRSASSEGGEDGSEHSADSFGSGEPSASHDGSGGRGGEAERVEHTKHDISNLFDF